MRFAERCNHIGSQPPMANPDLSTELSETVPEEFEFHYYTG